VRGKEGGKEGRREGAEETTSKMSVIEGGRE
jgi:hypothetical protein